MMKNGDLTRIINSDEIQRVAKTRQVRTIQLHIHCTRIRKLVDMYICEYISDNRNIISGVYILSRKICN